jgi:hypothetical protein
MTHAHKDSQFDINAILVNKKDEGCQSLDMIVFKS